jgi:protease I
VRDDCRRKNNVNAQDIKNAGAEYLDREVVEDGNFISSRSPENIPAFIKVSLDKLK